VAASDLVRRGDRRRTGGDRVGHTAMMLVLAAG
jgi:hypothetical protein